MLKKTKIITLSAALVFSGTVLSQSTGNSRSYPVSVLIEQGKNVYPDRISTVVNGQDFSKQTFDPNLTKNVIEVPGLVSWELKSDNGVSSFIQQSPVKTENLASDIVAADYSYVEFVGFTSQNSNQSKGIKPYAFARAGLPELDLTRYDAVYIKLATTRLDKKISISFQNPGNPRVLYQYETIPLCSNGVGLSLDYPLFSNNKRNFKLGCTGYLRIPLNNLTAYKNGLRFDEAKPFDKSSVSSISIGYKRSTLDGLGAEKQGFRFAVVGRIFAGIDLQSGKYETLTRSDIEGSYRRAVDSAERTLGASLTRQYTQIVESFVEAQEMPKSNTREYWLRQYSDPFVCSNYGEASNGKGVILSDGNQSLNVIQDAFIGQVAANARVRYLTDDKNRAILLRIPADFTKNSCGKGPEQQFLASVNQSIIEIFENSSALDVWLKKIVFEMLVFQTKLNGQQENLSFSKEIVELFLREKFSKIGLGVNEKINELRVKTGGVESFGLSLELISSLKNGVVFDRSAFGARIGEYSFALQMLFVAEFIPEINWQDYVRYFTRITQNNSRFGNPTKAWRRWQLTFGSGDLGSIANPATWKNYLPISE